MDNNNMKREYVGKEIKLGAINVFMPTFGGIIEGQSIYIAADDGLYYGVGDIDSSIWIQSIPQLPDENSNLFLEGVEFIDKYAPSGWKKDRCLKALKWLEQSKWKTGNKYCKLLQLFFDFGRWDRATNAERYFTDVYRKYKNFIA